jgi:hypothetical protein
MKIKMKLEVYIDNVWVDDVFFSKSVFKERVKKYIEEIMLPFAEKSEVKVLRMDVS